MKKNEETGNYEEASSLHQKFTRNKPGCFEFIMDAQGLFRLREPNEKITRKRRIAYIVKDGYKVTPGQGMTPISEHETSGSWEDTRIIEFDVDPGSSGSIVDIQTGEEIAVWRECYTAKIDKKRMIGETVDGVDLYGYAPCEEGTNGGLPVIIIEAAEGKSALDDLVITCICDDRKVSIPHPILWEDEFDELGPAQIALIPQKAVGFGGHVADCLIEARQKSAGGKAVFKYKFAVVPIQDFKPTAISFNLGTAIAEYGFQAVRDIDVINEQRDITAVDAWNRYTAKTLLKDEFLHVRIRSREQDKETDAKLALAAIDITIPEPLSSISEERPICLADVIKLGCGAANIKISSYGWRYNRAVIVWIGQEAIFFKKLKHPGEHVLNLFTYAFSFLQDNDSLPRKKPLRLSLMYGDETTQDSLKPAWTDVELLDCEQGIGIHGWEPRVTSNGAHILRFDGKLACNARFEFKAKAGEKTVAKASVSVGDETLILPSNVAKLLNTHRAVVVEVSPTDWFDNPLSEYTVRFNMRR